MKTKIFTTQFFTDTVKEMEVWVNEMDNYNSLKNVSIFWELTTQNWVAVVTYIK